MAEYKTVRGAMVDKLLGSKSAELTIELICNVPRVRCPGRTWDGVSCSMCDLAIADGETFVNRVMELTGESADKNRQGGSCLEPNRSVDAFPGGSTFTLKHKGVEKVEGYQIVGEEHGRVVLRKAKNS